MSGPVGATAPTAPDTSTPSTATPNGWSSRSLMSAIGASHAELLDERRIHVLLDARDVAVDDGGEHAVACAELVPAAPHGAPHLEAHHGSPGDGLSEEHVDREVVDEFVDGPCSGEALAGGNFAGAVVVPEQGIGVEHVIGGM